MNPSRRNHMYLYHIVVKSFTIKEARDIYKFVVAKNKKEANIKVQKRIEHALGKLSPNTNVTCRVKESWYISSLADILKVKAMIIDE